jgi:hypothetical protein
MTVPGFNAEASVYRSNHHYRCNGRTPGITYNVVLPQDCSGDCFAQYWGCLLLTFGDPACWVKLVECELNCPGPRGPPGPPSCCAPGAICSCGGRCVPGKGCIGGKCLRPGERCP